MFALTGRANVLVGAAWIALAFDRMHRDRVYWFWLGFGILWLAIGVGQCNFGRIKNAIDHKRVRGSSTTR